MTGGPEVDLERVVQSTLLGEALTNAVVAVLLADDRGQYVAVNDRACALTGYARDALCNLRAGELAADEASGRIYENLVQGRTRGRKVIRCRDGVVVPCEYWGIQTVVARMTYFALLLWEEGRQEPASLVPAAA